MQLTNLGNNKTIIEMNNGDEYFFSYNTCVAGFTVGEGYWKTSKKWSVTTSKHVNSYIGNADPTIVEQSDISVALSAVG